MDGRASRIEVEPMGLAWKPFRRIDIADLLQATTLRPWISTRFHYQGVSMKSKPAMTFFVVLAFTWSAWATRPITPRPITQHGLGTKVTFLRMGDSRKKGKLHKLPQPVADEIIEIANKIEMHQGPVSIRSRRVCIVGSFTIGETTVLHLLKVGILEDPSYQGVSSPSLKRLADILCENFDNINASVFMEWAESGHTSSNKATPRGC